MKLLLMLFLLVCAQLAQAADPIGRIFYSAAERAQLDALRAKRAVASQVRNEPIPEYVTYNGIVRRSDGQATVWVNGEFLTEAELRNKQSIIGRIGQGGQILVQTPQAQGTAQVRLKVGQSAELLSGRVDELYATQAGAPADKTKPKPAAAPGTVGAPATDAPAPESLQNRPAADSAAKPATKEVPPELLEALRQAAARNAKASATTENPQPPRRP